MSDVGIHDWTRGPKLLPAPGQRPRIGVDVAVGRRAIERLMAIGIDVVVRADPREPDESWFNRAIRQCAHAIVSIDMDLAIFCWTAGVLWIPIPQGARGPEQCDHIIWHLRTWRLLPPEEDTMDQNDAPVLTAQDLSDGMQLSSRAHPEWGTWTVFVDRFGNFCARGWSGEVLITDPADWVPA